VIEYVANKVGLSATLLQNDQLVAHASPFAIINETEICSN